jgi:capsular polysaccharide biosynthesis protein
MANTFPKTTTAAIEKAEPADDRTYINLVIAFLIGIAFLMGLFIAILLLLARAS